MKLESIKQISGKLTLLSGLHIGAGETEMHIGGTDNSVVSHPHTRLPYIPGSSLKGKVRALLEMHSGCMAATGGRPIRYGDLQEFKGVQLENATSICALFGISGADSEDAQEIGPTRASFSDCQLTHEWTAKARDVSLTEIKAETAIHRITGTAQGESLRMTERVVSGVEFNISINIKQMADDHNLTDLLLKGLKLLELDALGGSGSRGYGRVKFEFDDKEIQTKFTEISI